MKGKTLAEDSKTSYKKVFLRIIAVAVLLHCAVFLIHSSANSSMIPPDRQRAPKPLSAGMLKSLLPETSNYLVTESSTLPSTLNSEGGRRSKKDTMESWMPERMLIEPTASPLPQNTTSTPTKNMTKILLWNDFKTFGLSASLLWRYNCPYTSCLLTEDRKKFDLNEIDAVMWHARGNDKSMPKLGDSKAKMVFFLKESPNNLQMNLKPVKDKFDLTYTYRLDSDIPNGYGMVVKRRNRDESFLTTDFHAKKTALVAWFVSHCSTYSHRERLAATLQKHLSVDIYGTCDKLKCKEEIPCYKMLEKKYYFYLSFENSLCEDYMTEKIFYILRYNIIPVVYGLGPYRTQLPSRSYIDVFDFHSVGDLAKYLIYLTKNATAYNEYFRWKATMTVASAEYLNALSLCYLCGLLKQNFTSKQNDIDDWFVSKSYCRLGTEAPLSNFIRGKRLKRSYNEMLYAKRDRPMSFKKYSENLYDIYHLYI